MFEKKMQLLTVNDRAHRFHLEFLVEVFIWYTQGIRWTSSVFPWHTRPLIFKSPVYLKCKPSSDLTMKYPALLNVLNMADVYCHVCLRKVQKYGRSNTFPINDWRPPNQAMHVANHFNSWGDPNTKNSETTRTPYKSMLLFLFWVSKQIAKIIQCNWSYTWLVLNPNLVAHLLVI